MIYTLIGGSYVPFIVVLDQNVPSWLPHVVGVGCGVGILQSVFWAGAPRVMRTAAYLVLGYVATTVPAMYQHLGMDVVLLVLTGGLFYTIGDRLCQALPEPKPLGFRLTRSVPLPGKSRDGLSLRRNLVHSRRDKLGIEEERDSTERHSMSQTHELNHWTTHDHWYKRMLCGLVVKSSKFIMQTMNTVEFENSDEWNELTQQRDRGLLSFSNHVSYFDDPLLISNLGTTAYRQVRWIAADRKNFFGTALKGFIFSAGKCAHHSRWWTRSARL